VDSWWQQRSDIQSNKIGALERITPNK
jgi:hypothetical protein